MEYLIIAQESLIKKLEEYMSIPLTIARPVKLHNNEQLSLPIGQAISSVMMSSHGRSHLKKREPSKKEENL